MIYARQDFSLAAPRDTMDIGAYLETTDAPSLEPALPPSKTPRFLGRDDMYFKLELALPTKHVVLLHGAGGMGKTELAKAFGHWWQRTGALERRSWLFFYSFEFVVGPFNLDAMLNDIGTKILGDEKLNGIPADKRRTFITELLRRYRALIIWDNFETVHSMRPEGMRPFYSDNDLAKFKEFVGQIANGGKSSILITSRNAEAWLGNIHRLPLHGLKEAEAAELADYILTAYAKGRTKRNDPAFKVLLEALDGHPRSLHNMLPWLETRTIRELLAMMNSEIAWPEELVGETDPELSLLASVHYSIKHLEPKIQQILLVLPLFGRVVEASILGRFCQVTSLPARFAGASPTEWDQGLRRAASVGLLDPLADVAGSYRVPAGCGCLPKGPLAMRGEGRLPGGGANGARGIHRGKCQRARVAVLAA